MKIPAVIALVFLLSSLASTQPAHAGDGLPMGMYKRMLSSEKLEQSAGLYASGMLEAYQLMYTAQLINAGLPADEAAKATNKCVTRYSPQAWAMHLTTRFHSDNDTVAQIALAAFIECVGEDGPAISDR